MRDILLMIQMRGNQNLVFSRILNFVPKLSFVTWEIKSNFVQKAKLNFSTLNRFLASRNICDQLQLAVNLLGLECFWPIFSKIFFSNRTKMLLRLSKVCRYTAPTLFLVKMEYFRLKKSVFKWTPRVSMHAISMQISSMFIWQNVTIDSIVT